VLPRLAALGERLVAIGEALDRRAEELLAVGDRTERTLNDLDDVGRENARLGAQMLVTARESVEANREANVAIAALSERVDRLLELTGDVERLGEAAPALQSAAERVDRVASRIPGLRD
jgi:BMFP domain-containing protein YqiC